MLLQVGAASAQAQTKEPARYVLSASAGLPLRITRASELGQSQLAPAYADTLVGYVLPGPRGYRHGFGVGAAMNLARDGGYVLPVYAAQQLALMPAYLGYYDLGRDLLALGHLGLPLLVSGGRSFGLEAGFMFGYRWLAGAGVFAQLDLDAFAGAQSRVNLLASFALGIVVDYEVLP
jgi:hypothetical protein